MKLLTRIITLAILSSPLPAEALPQGVPEKQCGNLSDPKPGTLCYSVSRGGGKTSAGGSPQNFSTLIQATEPEYVIADVVIEVTGETGDKSGPTVHHLSPGGEASVVSVARDKLRELKQTKEELQVKATVLSGPALIEAQAKLSALQEQERIYEKTVTDTTAAGKDAGKFKVDASARSRKCGWAGVETCGSWIEYNIYVVKRYVGDPIAAYNKSFAVAQDAKDTINRLVATAEETARKQAEEAAMVQKEQQEAKAREEEIARKQAEDRKQAEEAKARLEQASPEQVVRNYFALLDKGEIEAAMGQRGFSSNEQRDEVRNSLEKIEWVKTSQIELVKADSDVTIVLVDLFSKVKESQSPGQSKLAIKLEKISGEWKITKMKKAN